jgi:ADP-heptose:LPS heptosyltransferase
MRYVIHCPRAIGDVLVLTTLFASLKQKYDCELDINSAFDDIFANNPNRTIIKNFNRKEFVEIDHHPWIISNPELSYIEAFHRDAEQKLGIDVPVLCNTPQLYLTDAEKDPFPSLPKDYLVLNASWKTDTSTKFYSHYREVAELLDMPIVQVGRNDDPFTLIPTAINWIGKTNTRQLLRLLYNSKGAIGGITFLQHASAALDVPYVCLYGGREPWHWINYPNQIKICGECPYSPCWSLQTFKQDAFFEKWYTANHNQPYKPYCLNVHQDGFSSCLSNIDPNEVAEKIKNFLHT